MGPVRTVSNQPFGGILKRMLSEILWFDRCEEISFERFFHCETTSGLETSGYRRPDQSIMKITLGQQYRPSMLSKHVRVITSAEPLPEINQRSFTLSDVPKGTMVFSHDFIALQENNISN